VGLLWKDLKHGSAPPKPPLLLRLQFAYLCSVTAIPGKYNDLEMVKYTDFGIYLDGGDLGEILMPLKYVPRDTNVGDSVHCFVYFDTADRIIATTETPLATIETCAYLECVAVTKFGAFLNWGLMKDLLVPFREQNLPLEEGKSYAVYIYADTTSNRIVASVKLDKHLNKLPPDFAEGDMVDLMIARKTDKGIVAVINDTHTGLLYHNEIFQPLKPGDRLKGFVTKLRPDGKTDLRLQETGYDALKGQEEGILKVLRANGGFLAVTDKSSPEEIYRLFEMSKKNWKKLIGTLYKNQRIEILPDGIQLIAEGD
jgi:predicted RNA-binding protein (virulence factor B family)